VAADEPTEQPEPEEEPDSAWEPEPAAAGDELPEGEPVRLAEADFDSLRELGMSVTQAKRLLRYRDERGLDSVAGLDDVPGFPRSFLDRLEGRLID
jgi:DNA uptake protein ComE-like DNA-binding protein